MIDAKSTTDNSQSQLSEQDRRFLRRAWLSNRKRLGISDNRPKPLADILPVLLRRILGKGVSCGR